MVRIPGENVQIFLCSWKACAVTVEIALGGDYRRRLVFPPALTFKRDNESLAPPEKGKRTEEKQKGQSLSMRFS
jgi:hypothetical protein